MTKDLYSTVTMSLIYNECLVYLKIWSISPLNCTELTILQSMVVWWTRLMEDMSVKLGKMMAWLRIYNDNSQSEDKLSLNLKKNFNARSGMKQEDTFITCSDTYECHRIPDSPVSHIKLCVDGARGGESIWCDPIRDLRSISVILVRICCWWYIIRQYVDGSECLGEIHCRNAC